MFSADLADKPQRTVFTTASNSSLVSGSGLACMLLARAAFSTTPGKSASVIPHARSAGMLSSAQSARTHSMPSSALASFGR